MAGMGDAAAATPVVGDSTKIRKRGDRDFDEGASKGCPGDGLGIAVVEILQQVLPGMLEDAAVKSRNYAAKYRGNEFHYGIRYNKAKTEYHNTRNEVQDNKNHIAWLNSFIHPTPYGPRVGDWQRHEFVQRRANLMKTVNNLVDEKLLLWRAAMDLKEKLRVATTNLNNGKAWERSITETRNALKIAGFRF